jgi:glycosyltransferase involved in cell wall biosynthesis
MRIGIIARSDNTGLGNQTRELTKMLNPDKVMLIDSTSFNKNKQYPEKYDGYNVTVIKGIPNITQVRTFMRDLDVIISCETFYNDDLMILAKRLGVKTVLQYNYELFGNLQNLKMPLPDTLIAPSKWNMDDVEFLFGDKAKVVHIPPPTDREKFLEAREVNTSKKHKRILHIGGKAAAMDRNGTKSIIEMLKHSKADYELVIKTQSDLKIECNDPRLVIDTGNPDNEADMYVGFDAMVLPRRYAGLCLPMNEALMSGLPVFMTDISPNNFILPSEWLTEASTIGVVQTKKPVDLYDVDPVKLAKLIDDYVESDQTEAKQMAIRIAEDNFLSSNLVNKYIEVLENK